MDDISANYPAVDFVKYLLLNISHHCGIEFRLDEQADMAKLIDRPDTAFPPLDNIVNRLKVMCGFDPIFFPKVKEGVIKVRIGSDNGTAHSFNFAVKFDDLQKVVFLTASGSANT